MADTSQAQRLRQARERAGLSVADVAEGIGRSEACVWDLEAFDDELDSVCCPADLARLAAVLGTSPADLLGIPPPPEPIGPASLAAAIRACCKASATTIPAVEDACGWRVADALDRPGQFRLDFSLDGIRGVCHAAGLPWEPVACGLTVAT